METFLLNLLKTSLLGSLAILAMLVLKPLWRERYRAKTRCWLWLALAAFLLSTAMRVGPGGIFAAAGRFFGEKRAGAGRAAEGLHPLCRHG